ncbi:uncharacterized protein LOC125947453 [Dermacentor silvarum]|uniref:uncharacterized protein LOC125947453 n=1 Tax=Dermacentor silvarum TaxID=543639 RepID=UPI0021012FAA|nr:uncharacterized protein LOC125947453 [Dermacentor silvarum]
MDTVADAEPSNEDLAREAGLHFSDFSETEREMIIRARAAGVSAYDGEPPAAPTGSEASFSSTDCEPSGSPGDDVPDDGEELHSRLTSTDWCDCGHCVVLSNFTESECLCCREMGDPVTAAQPEGCITAHPEFHTVCLNIAVLRIAYFELRARNDCMDEDIHK